MSAVESRAAVVGGHSTSVNISISLERHTFAAVSPLGTLGRKLPRHIIRHMLAGIESYAETRIIHIAVGQHCRHPHIQHIHRRVERRIRMPGLLLRGHASEHTAHQGDNDNDCKDGRALTCERRAARWSVFSHCLKRFGI